MVQIKVYKCLIEGLYIIASAVHGDARGYFMETYNQKDMKKLVIGANGYLGQDMFYKYRR